MKFIFEKRNDKEEIIAYAKEKTELIKTIENLCNQQNNKILAYKDEIIKELDP